MKKKQYFQLVQMLMVMLLFCACSGKEQTDALVQSQDGTSERTVVENVKSAEGTVSETFERKSDAAAPDLNRNGITEEVFLTDIEDGQELEIRENGELVDREIGHFSHAGGTSIFLCTLDGEDYLLRYHPTMYQGVGSYSYALETLIDNKESVVKWNEVAFDINFGSFHHNGFDPEDVAAFMDEINDLLSHSVQLLNTESDLLATFEKEGRLYDSLWWLDSQEPNFVRDANKSLAENLGEFQKAMAAAGEPVALEEVESLPVTEPLELSFYSGAGAWATYLVLKPDGSFAAHYHDSDGLTVYICPFYGRFGKVERLTDASWLLTLEELHRDTDRSVGEEWEETEGEDTFHFIASEPYGFTDAEGKALKPGAQFILYGPDALGHEPGTELYGAVQFQHWMHGYREFSGKEDRLGCWGLQNRETGQGFFDDSDSSDIHL